MLNLVARTRFRRDVKLAHKRRKNLDKLDNIVVQLRAGKVLPPKNKPHMLTGEWYGYYECHIEPDWLLIYHLTSDTLTLVRTGTHSDLFE